MNREATETQFQPAAAHMVEHHDFFSDPQRMVHRRDIEQGTEAQSLASLRHRRKEHAGRGRHAERGRVMFGDMIGAKAGPIVLLDELEPRLEQVGQRSAVVVDMIENAELQGHGAFSPEMFFYRSILTPARADFLGRRS